MSDERPDPESSLVADRASLEEGISLFNARQFWKAHEAWERIWLLAEGEQKLFLQGLIQLAAAYHHVQKRTYAGGLRLFDAALEKLSRFPDGYLGVDRAHAVRMAGLHRDGIEKNENIAEKDFPNIRYN